MVAGLVSQARAGQSISHEHDALKAVRDGQRQHRQIVQILQDELRSPTLTCLMTMQSRVIAHFPSEHDGVCSSRREQKGHCGMFMPQVSDGCCKSMPVRGRLFPAKWQLQDLTGIEVPASSPERGGLEGHWFLACCGIENIEAIRLSTCSASWFVPRCAKRSVALETTRACMQIARRYRC